MILGFLVFRPETISKDEGISHFSMDLDRRFVVFVYQTTSGTNIGTPGTANNSTTA